MPQPTFFARRHRVGLLAALLALLLMLGALPAATRAQGDSQRSPDALLASYVVNSAADPGTGGCDATECTLREAITLANSTAAFDVITFNIPGAGPHTIAPTSPLPTISAPLRITGKSQPGTECVGHDLRLVLNGAGAGAGANGFTATARFYLRGFVIQNFDGAGVAFLQGSNGGDVTCSHIGTNAAATAAAGNRNGIFLDRVNYVTIGSSIADEYNIISGNSSRGIYVVGSNLAQGQYNTIRQNYIGTDATGMSAIPNGFNGLTLRFAGYNTVVDNLISGNNFSGIQLLQASTNFNTIQRNRIGQAANGAPLGNALHGILVTPFTRNNLIGGSSASDGNAISYNGGDGVFVDVAADRTAILSNSMAGNLGLGIDLAANGFTPNDANDADGGANQLQNFPVVSSAVVNGLGELVVTYSVPSDPANSLYPLRVQFFQGAGSPCQGLTLLGSDSYTTTDYPGAKVVNLGNAGVGFAAGSPLTATATDANNNSSEFAPCVTATN